MALIFGVSALFSCKGENGPVEVTGEINYGYILKLNAQLWSIYEDTKAETDKLTWIGSLSLGEKVETGEIRQATYPNSELVDDVIEIKSDSGIKGYVLSRDIAVGGQLAVVIDRSFRYSWSRDTDRLGGSVSRGTVAVCYPDTESDGFIKTVCFEPVGRVYFTRPDYMRLSSLSGNESDIQSSILLQTALSLNEIEKVRRDALLEQALLSYPDSEFHAEIEAYLYPDTDGVIETEAVGFYMTVFNSVKVRDLPDAVNGTEIDTLYSGVVLIGEQTSSMYIIDGRVARWYRVISPIEGWVFGYNLVNRR